MKLAASIRENALFNGLLQRFNQLSPALQFALGAAVSLLIISLLVFKLIVPLNTSRTSALQRLPQLERDYVLMQAQALEIESLSKSPSITATPPAAKIKAPLSVAAITAQFGGMAGVTKTSETVFQLNQSGTTMAQFISNVAALQASTGATLGDFSLKPDANKTAGLVTVTAVLQAAKS
jgi:type II secretory pathway component PulM